MGFIMENIRVIGIVYLIGAIINFIGLFAFFVVSLLSVSLVSTSKLDIWSTMSIPDVTFPNAAYCPSRLVLSAVIIKNWHDAELYPYLVRLGVEL